MSTRARPSVAANPVLVGAATLLIVVVGVFLAYNANSGLPFVPTYELDAHVPDAAELTVGNDVRVGGKRVGVVSGIRAHEDPDGHVSAVLHLKLEKTLEPLRDDTRVTVRPRSTLGLKYLELVPGTRGRPLRAGAAIPESHAGRIVELDDALNAFDHGTREGIRATTTEFSRGFAGRGADLSTALENLRPLVADLGPVMRTLRSRDADLPGFLDGVASGAGAVAPVAPALSSLLGNAAQTFAAVDRARPAVEDLLDLAPGTERAGAQDLAVARPVLQGAAALAAAARAGSAELPRATRRLRAAVETGIPVLGRATALGPELERALRAVRTVARNPATGGSLVELTRLVRSLATTLRFANPFQTECNALGLWTRNAADVISEGDANGTWFRFMPVLQPTETFQSATPAPDLHLTTYGETHGECETGNEGWAPGRVIGHAPGRQPDHTQATAPPPGVGR